MESTKLNIPAEDVTVRAVYKDDDFPIIVKNGGGGGDYQGGAEVTVTVDSCPQDQEFEKWVIINRSPISFDDVNYPSTTVTMPDSQ